MQSTIQWLDDKKSIALIESHGKWDAASLLELGDEVLGAQPRILIWDPTNIILDTELLVTRIEESSAERQQVFQIMIDVLSKTEESRFIVVRKRSIPVFDALQEIYEQRNMDHKLVFCASQEEAFKLI